MIILGAGSGMSFVPITRLQGRFHRRRAALCALGVVVAIALLPRRPRAAADQHAEAVALSFARCPGAPYCGHLARVVAVGRRVRSGFARL